MDYFEKIDKNVYEDLRWNIPERKQGTMNVIGGNVGNFRTEIKIAEYVDAEFHLENVNVVMPEVLKGKLPSLPNFKFMPATDSGAFAESQELIRVFDEADFNLVLGDLSRNTIAGKAISSALKSSGKMTLITRDTVDLVMDHQADRLLMNESLIVMLSLPQLQKMLKAVYYPKMLLASQSLVQVADVLHKFTLSYPVSIVTLHNGQILVAENGIVKAVSLDLSGYTPIMFWSGELAAKIVAMNLYNPNSFIGATICAIFG